jgi:hypothetical protein
MTEYQIDIHRIDVSIRLRRAIHLNDPLLGRRIIQNNIHALRNPDFDDKSNTSLHIAAKLGYVEITVRLAMNLKM